MGTRGAFGVRIDGVDKIAYNQFDSYPDGLGDAVARFARSAAMHLDSARQGARALRVISKDAPPPSAEDQLRLSRWFDGDVGGSRPIDEWYRLLRDTQGDLFAVLEAGALIDCADFMSDSLFCEWAYVVNLDECTFEVYRGFQRRPHQKGRFASAQRRESSRWHPVALFAAYPIGNIPADWIAQAEAAADAEREQ